jgi:hypothetical protein
MVLGQARKKKMLMDYLVGFSNFKEPKGYTMTVRFAIEPAVGVILIPPCHTPYATASAIEIENTGRWYRRRPNHSSQLSRKFPEARESSLAHPFRVDGDRAKWQFRKETAEFIILIVAFGFRRCHFELTRLVNSA